VLAGSSIIIAFSLTRYRSILQRTGKVRPEERLIPMMIGSVLLPRGCSGLDGRRVLESSGYLRSSQADSLGLGYC
jgi:hypothetical protein